VFLVSIRRRVGVLREVHVIQTSILEDTGSKRSSSTFKLAAVRSPDEARSDVEDHIISLCNETLGREVGDD
jgi:hypothetical protein